MGREPSHGLNIQAMIRPGGNDGSYGRRPSRVNIPKGVQNEKGVGEALVRIHGMCRWVHRIHIVSGPAASSGHGPGHTGCYLHRMAI